MNYQGIILAAHRGDRKTCPENTMPAFEAALNAGMDMIETDIRMTKDGELVVFHDEEVSRTTGAKGWVKDMTLAEMRELDPSNGFDMNDIYGYLYATLREGKEFPVKNAEGFAVVRTTLAIRREHPRFTSAGDIL